MLAKAQTIDGIGMEFSLMASIAGKKFLESPCRQDNPTINICCVRGHLTGFTVNVAYMIHHISYLPSSAFSVQKSFLVTMSASIFSDSIKKTKKNADEIHES
ncbi:MAG: hypothetical protein HQL95_03860 [Magnetococcales bacterium]|nr:hypothetical protein [Magnetococcales bacterium]